MGITVTQPLFLTLWLFIPVIWALLNRSILKERPFRSRLVVGGFRTFLVLLLGLALAQPRWTQDSDRVNLFFCLDMSDSIKNDERPRAMEVIREAVQGMGEEDQAGLIVFGQKPSLEIPLKKEFAFEEIQSRVEPSFTDISRALELAIARLPERGKNRIVLFTDGNENLGQTREMAYLARSMGIEIFPFPLDSWYQGKEVYLRDLWTPPTIPMETPFPVRLTIMSPSQGPADISLFRENRLLIRQPIELREGKNIHQFIDRLETPGLYLYRAVVNAPFDAVFENNIGLSFTQGSSRPGILYISDGEGSEKSLVAALRAQELNIVQRSPDGVPQSLQGFVEYSAIVLDNVSASRFSISTLELLEKYVKDMGGGLVMVGGDQSFGAGNYLNTPVERALPVFMEAPTKVEFPGVCLILVIDKSASMSGYLKGTNKLNAAKSAAFSAAELLNPEDQVGILAFDSSVHWAVPLTQAKERKRIAQELSKLEAGGGTDLFIGLREAFQVLRGIPAAKKHIIALSDGLTLEADFRSLLSSLRNEKITVSTVAVGSNSDRRLLYDIAQLGGGRSYYTDDASNVPRILVGETKIVAQKLIVEQDLQPLPGGRNEMISGFEEGSFPKVKGLVITYTKPGAQILLDTQEGPLLVSWRYGLGKSVAFTSDLGGRWGQEWVLWSHYEKFVSQIVRWATRKEDPRNYTAKIENQSETGIFTVDVTDEENRFVNRLPLKLKVLWPSGRSQTLSLDQIAPGMYRGNFAAHEIGEYYVTLFGQDDKAPLAPQTFGYGIPYTAEYQKMGMDEELLKNIASITQGKMFRLGDDLQGLFRADPKLKEYGENIWIYVALVSLLILMGDITARKLLLLHRKGDILYSPVKRRNNL